MPHVHKSYPYHLPVEENPLRSSRGIIATLIVTTTLAIALPPQGWALIAPARVSAAAQAASDNIREQDMKIIQKTLESKILRQRLREFGFSPTETDRRLTKLSDAQVHQLAMQSQRLNPGGGLLIGLLVLGILVLLFIYLLKRVL